jgi:hypothetical protein
MIRLFKKFSPGVRLLLSVVLIGQVYAVLIMWIMSALSETVSIAFICAFPFMLGAIPVFLATQEQLRSYTTMILYPILSIALFFLISLFFHLDGLICLTVIIAPFLLLACIGAFIVRLILLKRKGPRTPLYVSLLFPLLFMFAEKAFIARDAIRTVDTTIEVHAPRAMIWENMKNVRHIQSTEIKSHFVHLIGVPKPLNGELDKEGPGGIRSITWEKGISFKETIESWQEGWGFTYRIQVDPKSIPPTTLDEHVLVGGKYFDVQAGSYRIDSVGPARFVITLSCQYRVTTTFNTYSMLWAGFLLNDFNQMILEVIKNRAETEQLKNTARSSPCVLNKKIEGC